MRDFFESNTGRHGTSGIWPVLAAAAPSLIGGGLSIAGGLFSGRGAAKQAAKQNRRNTANQANFANQEAAAAREAAEGATLANVGSSFGTAESGFDFNGEFITEQDAMDRGLIRKNVRNDIYVHSKGRGFWQPTYSDQVDDRLQQSQRTRLSPELESIRQQALGFQGLAGQELQKGFQGIDSGLAERELSLMNQLAMPREAERREQLFGMLQRTGRLESTPGASIFSGAEEAFGREGLQRELSARGTARDERDRAFRGNLDLFGLGNQTTSSLANLENMLANRQIGVTGALQGQPGFTPGIQIPQMQPQVGSGQLLGAGLAGLAPHIAQMDFGGLFGGRGDSGGGEDYLASSLLPSRSKSEEIFGNFWRN